MFAIPSPYLLFIEGARDSLEAKTAHGILYWRPELCLGQLRTNNENAELPIEKITLEEAVAKGAKTLVIGLSPFGGKIKESWIPILQQALEKGLHIVSGLHESLNNIDVITSTAKKNNRKLIELRRPKPETTIGSGKKRTGKRLLTIGTDCSVGKMFTALAIERALKKKNVKTTFRATGQTGILIAKQGIPFDAIKCDFATGEVEGLSPNNDEDHWDIIEGQGSILHPTCGVILSLLHGSQPDAIVLCHDPNRTHLYGFPHFKIPEIQECIDRHIEAIKLTNKKVKCIGISINTLNETEKEARKTIEYYQLRYNMPCTDPLRFGVGDFIRELIKSEVTLTQQ